jgi:hypothetical protein
MSVEGGGIFFIFCGSEAKRPRKWGKTFKEMG